MRPRTVRSCVDPYGIQVRVAAGRRDSDFDASAFSSPTVLPNLEPLELRMPEIEGFVVARAVMCGSKRVGFGPRFEGGVVLPHRVGCVKRVILRFGAPKQMEFDEAGYLVEMSIARQPDFLEGCFGAFGDAEPVHSDEHRTIS